MDWQDKNDTLLRCVKYKRLVREIMKTVALNYEDLKNSLMKLTDITYGNEDVIVCC